MKKRNLAVLVATMLLGTLGGCKGKKPSISIMYDGESEQVKFAIEDIKDSITRNGHSLKESGGEYTVKFTDFDTSLGSEDYSMVVENKTISITAGGETGLMYGGLQFAQELDMEGEISVVKSKSETMYIQERGVRIRYSTDARTPSYTNQADCVRANAENTWDLDFWKDKFDTLARMRVNGITFGEINNIASMVQVPGYEDCALEDVYIYEGEYDDTYLGNATNMFRKEHMNNARLFKKMTIQEKTDFWKQVFQAAVDRGIKVGLNFMNIYTFAEDGKYGITDRRDNPTTKDYFYKALKKILAEFPQISSLSGSQGENMDYPAETQEESDKWICDTYVRAVREMCEEDPERAKTFQYGCQALANGQLTDYFLAEMNTLPCEVFASKRYNDTHLYSVTDVTDNNEYLSRLPSKVKMKYMLKADDCIHFTWANADFARELMRNVIDTPLEKEKVLGFTWGTDTYDIIGNEYEFKDEEMNGKAYIQRHWTDLSLISRSAYNPDGMSNEDWEKTFVAKYRETSADVSKKVWEVMNEAAMVFPAFLKQYQPSGTDAALLAELCWSNPTLFGFLDIKRFANSDNADPDGNTMSIAEYARAITDGQTNFEKRTPLDTIADLKQISNKVAEMIPSLKESVNPETAKELYNIVLDQETLGYLSGFYAYHIEAALMLRRYNDSQEESFRQDALSACNKSIEYFTKFADSYDARFQVERLARHGVIDVKQMLETLKKEISTIEKWKPRNY